MIQEAYQRLVDTYLASPHRKKVDVIEKAFRFARQAHHGVRRLSGEPYIMHPLSVAQIVCGEIGLGSTSICAALLHDVVEDTPYTIEDLRAMGYPEEVIEAVTLLTHDDDTPYLEYVARIKHNPLARAVKLADLKHNSDVTRLNSPADLNPEQAQRYQQARAILEEELH